MLTDRFCIVHVSSEENAAHAILVIFVVTIHPGHALISGVELRTYSGPEPQLEISFLQILNFPKCPYDTMLLLGARTSQRNT